MKITLHKAATRGSANHGWLKTNFTFSFADYYNPERIHFGKLRVLNDDTIAAGTGFDLHPHNNMEIITIPLFGAIKHTDNTGGSKIIAKGQVQVMTAGTGIWHSEFNASDKEELRLLQIWIFPEKQNLNPRYETKTYDFKSLNNELKLVAGAADFPGEHLKINQQAFVSFGKLKKGKTIPYSFFKPENGAYIFIVNGKIGINEHMLDCCDGLGIEYVDKIQMEGLDDSEFVIFEIPML
jgi:redox-sensitive bicupin YhaK (pirin superfamily)